jgi:hypothetical protein
VLAVRITEEVFAGEASTRKKEHMCKGSGFSAWVLAVRIPEAVLAG